MERLSPRIDPPHRDRQHDRPARTRCDDHASEGAVHSRPTASHTGASPRRQRSDAGTGHDADAIRSCHTGAIQKPHTGNSLRSRPPAQRCITPAFCPRGTTPRLPPLSGPRPIMQTAGVTQRPSTASSASTAGVCAVGPRGRAARSGFASRVSQDLARRRDPRDTPLPLTAYLASQHPGPRSATVECARQEVEGRGRRTGRARARQTRREWRADPPPQTTTHPSDLG